MEIAYEAFQGSVDDEELLNDHLREPTPSPQSPPPLSEEELMELRRCGKSPRWEQGTSVTFSPPTHETVSDHDDNESDDFSCTEDSSQQEHSVVSTAMRNQVILTNMFELCPTDVLAKFRLVSKLWHDLSLASWRSSVCLLFKEEMFREGYRYFSKFWTSTDVMDHAPVCTLHKFLQFVEDPKNQCEKKPYKQFNLKEWSFFPSHDLIDQFWQLCANSITTLVLDECYFEGVETFRNVIYDACPNLQKLTVKDYRLPGFFLAPREDEEYEEPCRGEHPNLKSLTIDMNHEPLPVSWLEILSHFPGLTALQLYNADMDDAVEVMLKAIKIIRNKDKRKLVLKTFDILSASLYAQEVVSPGVSILLRELQLPLETLTIDLGTSTDHKIIKNIVEVHAPTLKKLNAYRGPYSTPYKSFPFGIRLEHLQKFYLSDKLPSNMEFLKFTPNLKMLHICDAVEDRLLYTPTKIVSNTWEPELETVRLVHLTDFRLDYTISEIDLQSLVKWMPNVERLRMLLNDKQFAIICDNWQKLEHLHVCGIELTDEGITGRRRYADEETAERKEMATVRPNITCLKGLRTFIMDNDGGVPTELLERSATYGFLKLDSLVSLRLSSHMNDRAKKALMDKIPDCQITRVGNNEKERRSDTVESVL